MRLARARFAIASSAAILAWLFALLTNGSAGGWDPAVLAWFRAGESPVLARNARLFTELGGWIFLTVAGLAAFITLAFKRRRRAALLLFILFGGRLLVELQKLLIAAPRPPASGFLAPAESLGFPSAHAANSMITFLAIALLVPVVQRRRTMAVVIGLTLALLVGLSRLVLGVHWPSDVIGGWAFALFWVALCIRLASARPEAEAAETVR
ncbi:MAG TPA: phosphatase PAP2 family protein [Allosphingosinicella sp.]|jgi:undecaprenyl-diphosphatase|uniref:phosphatase PAP2 family protein n=1 Tax=Allosphingosinicella sp. TaxID=2823234 RepID=UPI002F27E091